MSPSTLVLVDSYIWIEFFKYGNKKLEVLIEEDLVCTNELILTELIPILQKNKNVEAVDGLLAITNIELDIDWLGIQKLQLINLKNGINKVGILDLIILQQVLDHKIQLFTLDRHFELMTKHFEFKLY